MLKRVLSGISSNALHQAVNLLVQIIGIPLFIAQWGVEYYGEWIILFTIPGYIAISDLGLGTAATTEMSMMFERGEYAEITKLLRNSFWFVVLIGAIPVSILIGSVMVLPWYDWLNFSAMTTLEFNFSFMILILYVYMSVFMSLPLNYYRVEKKFHRERLISSLFKLLEFGTVVFLLLSGNGVISIALGFLFWRILMLFIIFYDLNQKSMIFRLLPITINVKEIQGILKPGVSLLGFFFGQNLLNQGLVTIIGLTLGSRMVVVYTTIRTLVNAVKQLIGTVNQAIFSEFSYAKGKRGDEVLYQIFVVGLLVNISLSVFSCLIIIVFGQNILKAWTGNHIEFNRFFLNLMVGYVFLSTLSHYALTFVGALNQFRRLSSVYVIMVLITLMLASFSHVLGHLSYVACLLLCFELVFLLLSTKVCLELLDKRFIEIFHFSKINWQLIKINR